MWKPKLRKWLCCLLRWTHTRNRLAISDRSAGTKHTQNATHPKMQKLNCSEHLCLQACGVCGWSLFSSKVRPDKTTYIDLFLELVSPQLHIVSQKSYFAYSFVIQKVGNLSWNYLLAKSHVSYIKECVRNLFRNKFWLECKRVPKSTEKKRQHTRTCRFLQRSVFCIFGGVAFSGVLCQLG